VIAVATLDFSFALQKKLQTTALSVCPCGKWEKKKCGIELFNQSKRCYATSTAIHCQPLDNVFSLSLLFTNKPQHPHFDFIVIRKDWDHHPFEQLELLSIMTTETGFQTMKY